MSFHPISATVDMSQALASIDRLAEATVALLPLQPINLRSREDSRQPDLESVQANGKAVRIRFRGAQLQGWLYCGWVYSADPRPFRVQVLG